MSEYNTQAKKDEAIYLRDVVFKGEGLAWKAYIMDVQENIMLFLDDDEPQNKKTEAKNKLKNLRALKNNPNN